MPKSRLDHVENILKGGVCFLSSRILQTKKHRSVECYGMNGGGMKVIWGKLAGADSPESSAAFTRNGQWGKPPREAVFEATIKEVVGILQSIV